MEKISAEELVNRIKSGKLTIASFPLFAELAGMLVAGIPDAVVFMHSKPLLVIELKTTKHNVTRMWKDQKIQLLIYAALLERMGFDLNSATLALVRVRTNVLSNVGREKLLGRIINHLLSIEKLPKTMNSQVGIFTLDYDSNKIDKELEWASEYWLNRRDPIPTKNATKCIACEYNDVCAHSLVSRRTN
ncbi:MAG: PD-(D/E)XK nuclease family protein [Conexivisphaerales archaeon]